MTYKTRFYNVETAFCTKCNEQTPHHRLPYKFYPPDFDECTECGEWKKTVSIFVTYDSSCVIGIRK